MKIVEDRSGVKAILVREGEERTKVIERASECMKEIRQALQKHNCRIEYRNYGEETSIVPMSDDGLQHVFVNTKQGIEIVDLRFGEALIDWYYKCFDWAYASLNKTIKAEED